MGIEKAALLDRLIERSFPINLLYEARNNQHTRTIADLILASQSVVERAKNEWTYKSLADFGEEEFIRTGYIFYHEKRDWVDEAIRDFSNCIYRHVWFEENEGLIFYIQENGKYRAARNGDPAYDFVCRLREEGSLSDLRFSAAPKWAHELYIFRPNYQAYCLMWHDCSNTSDPNYQQSKKLKAEAVIRETARLAGMVSPTEVDARTVEEKPLSTRERNTLLSIILGMAIDSYGFDPDATRSDAPKKISDDLSRHNISVSDDTIRKWLKLAAEGGTGVYEPSKGG